MSDDEPRASGQHPERPGLSRPCRDLIANFGGAEDAVSASAGRVGRRAESVDRDRESLT